MMKPSDKHKFFEVLSGVHDFYGRELSTFAADVWWQATHGYELEQVTMALSAHLMNPDNGQFMPKPADLVRRLSGTHADRALVAWGKALEAASRVGAYSSVAFDDPAIHHAIHDVGGWTTFCRYPSDELQFLQKRFCDAHKAYTARGVTEGPALIGEHDITNARFGVRQAVVLIGDEKKARAIGSKPSQVIAITRGGAE